MPSVTHLQVLSRRPMALYREGAVDNDTIYGLVVNYDPDNNGDGIAEASRTSFAKIYRYRVNENDNNAQQRLQALDSIELYHHVFAAVDDGNNLNLIINGGPSPDRLFMLRLSKDVLTNDVAGRTINIFDAMNCIDNNLVRALGGEDCEAACPVASTSGEGDVRNVVDSALIELVNAPNANTTGVSVDVSEAFTLNHAENPRHLIAIGGGEQLPGVEEMGQAAEKPVNSSCMAYTVGFTARSPLSKVKVASSLTASKTRQAESLTMAQPHCRMCKWS